MQITHTHRFLAMTLATNTEGSSIPHIFASTPAKLVLRVRLCSDVRQRHSNFFSLVKTAPRRHCHLCPLLYPPPPLLAVLSIYPRRTIHPPPLFPTPPRVDLGLWRTPAPIQTDSRQPSCQDAGAQTQLQGMLTIIYP